MAGDYPAPIFALVHGEIDQNMCLWLLKVEAEPNPLPPEPTKEVVAKPVEGTEEEEEGVEGK